MPVSAQIRAAIETLCPRVCHCGEKVACTTDKTGRACRGQTRRSPMLMTGGWELALSKIATGDGRPTFHRGIEVFASQIAKELLESKNRRRGGDTACPRCGRPGVLSQTRQVSESRLRPDRMENRGPQGADRQSSELGNPGPLPRLSNQ